MAWSDAAREAARLARQRRQFQSPAGSKKITSIIRQLRKKVSSLDRQIEYIEGTGRNSKNLKSLATLRNRLSRLAARIEF